MGNDFEKMIAKLRKLIDSTADDLYRRIVIEIRERVVTLCVLRDKLKKGHAR